MTIQQAVMNLDIAVACGGGEKVDKAVGTLMQTLANGFCAVSRQVPDRYHGLVLATARAFVASLETIADAKDLAIAEVIEAKTHTVTVAPGAGKEGGET